MADRSESGWNKKFTSFKHYHGVIRQVGSGNEAWAEFEEVQTRGLQRDRKQKPAREASDPPADLPPLNYPQHYMPDPGPHAGYHTWSSQRPNQQTQSQHSGDYNQPSYYPGQQSLTHPPPNSYGYNYQSSASPPPTSAIYGSYAQGYQPPPGSSGSNNHGSQSSNNYTVSPTSYSPVSNQRDLSSSNSTSQPYDHGYGGQGRNQNDPNGIYGSSNPGQSPDRVASAPECPYNRPNDGS